MKGSNEKHSRRAESTARARSCALFAVLVILYAAGTVRSDQPHSVVVLAGSGETQRTDELQQALFAHLIDTGIEPRIITLERRPDCPPEPGDTSLERRFSGQVVSIVWLSDSGDRFCMLTPEIDSEIRQREITDAGESWASRCEIAASMVLSEVEPLVRREGQKDSDQDSQKGSSRFGFAPRVGLSVPTSDLDPFIVAALEIDFFLSVLDQRLALALDTSFTRPGYSGRGVDPRIGGEYTYKLRVFQLKAALDVVLRFASKRSVPIPYLGLGPILHYVRTVQTTSIAAGENTEWSLEPGFEVLVGLDIPIGPGFLLFDFRYVLTDLDHRFTGDSNTGNVTTTTGYRFVF